MKKQIYLDNASTTFPKPPCVTEAVAFYMEKVGCNISRGGYEGAYSAGAVVIETRARLARLFGAPSPRHVVFTSGVTQSLNMLVRGLLRPGDHILVSGMEHNALMRPLQQLSQRGVEVGLIPCDANGEMDPADAESLLRPSTRALCVLHASNVCGSVLPLAELGAVAKAHGLFFLTDAAQTAGVFSIDMGEMGLDAVAFTGHKGLLGPQGTGGIALSQRLADALEPVVSGGTGSLSDSEEMPAFLPDKFEPGTMNLPGLYGLHAALGYIEEIGIDVIREKEQRLAAMLRDGLAEMPGVRMPGPPDFSRRAAIVSVDFVGRDNAEVAERLAAEHGVLTRCGLHCSPAAHRTLGTFPQGMVRLSPSHVTTEAEIEAAVRAVWAALA